MKNSLKTLIQKLPNESLTIIRGNSLIIRNGDVHYPFRQDSNFLYLTGLSIPGLILTIYSQEVILWREPINDQDKIWGSDKIPDYETERISGIKDIRDTIGLEEYCNYHPIPEDQPWQSIVHELRTIKTPEEIQKIQNCIRITESIYQEVLKKVQPGMYEYEIEAIIAYGFRRHHGVEAFPTIVASGPNSCILHYTRNTRQIQSGDLILIDFGIELDGYGADISRTFMVSRSSFGKELSEGSQDGGFPCFLLSHEEKVQYTRQREIYKAVQEVKEYAEKTLKPGITRKAWNYGIKEYMYDFCVRLKLPNIKNYTPLNNPYYPHSIGHFLGLDTHDVGNSEMILKPGMVLTIEPGIYIQDESIGVRMEDDYLLTETGCVKL